MNIENHSGKKISVLIETSENPRGLAFVMHGLGGFKEQDHIQMFADAFKEKGFSVVRFDVRNTIGESEGAHEEATVTSYYEDLEDVIAWARTQEWFREPFVLCGHSLGGMCTSLYAEMHPEQVMAIAPISPSVSGALFVEAKKRDDAGVFTAWEQAGWQEKMSVSKPGTMLRLPWSFVADILKYDLLPNAKKLTMPALLIVGEEDVSTPPDHIQKLYDALSGPKEIHVIPGASHSFREEGSLEEVKKILLEWIGRLRT